MDFQLNDNDKKRFWSKVDIKGEDECWNWRGYCSKKGYGTTLTIKGMQRRSHRISLLLSTGNVLNFLDPKMMACHTCKQNRKCVNPNHLYWGTQQDNTNDMLREGTQTKGEEVWQSKLTEEQVREIRDKCKNTDDTLVSIAKEYNVNPCCIDSIITCRTWKHISTEKIVKIPNPKGGKNSQSKITEDDVREIRRRYAEDRARPNRKRCDENNLTHEKLAVEFNISAPNITTIINRKSWTHI